MASHRRWYDVALGCVPDVMIDGVIDIYFERCEYYFIDCVRNFLFLCLSEYYIKDVFNW